MENLNENQLLKYAIENGIIDIDTIQRQIVMNERKKYLEMHKARVKVILFIYFVTILTILFVNESINGKPDILSEWVFS